MEFKRTDRVDGIVVAVGDGGRWDSSVRKLVVVELCRASPTVRCVGQ